jgi:hypothetical protein
MAMDSGLAPSTPLGMTSERPFPPPRRAIIANSAVASMQFGDRGGAE